jgi:hypothetical protein
MQIIVVKLCKSLFLTFDPPSEDAFMRLKHAGPHNYLLIEKLIHFMFFLYAF